MYTKLSPNLDNDQPMANPISLMSLTIVTHTHFMWKQIPDIIYFMHRQFIVPSLLLNDKNLNSLVGVVCKLL